MKGFEIRVSAPEERRILTRMSRLGWDKIPEGRIHLPRPIVQLARHGSVEGFVGRLGGTRIGVRLRKRRGLEVRITFTPAIAFRKGWRLVTRLGLHPVEGTWL